MAEEQKMMVVGAGRDQIAIIKKVQQLGFKAIVISRDGDYPGFLIADKSYKIDIRRKEEILKIAQSESICGIVSDQLDEAVLTVAYVAEQTGLPGIGYDCALKFTDKYKMRQFCKEIGIPVPAHFQASSLSQAAQYAKQLEFPLVIKPVDSGGSRGVSKVNNLSELEEKFHASLDCSASGYVILEEYFSGSEIVTEGFVSNYEVTPLVLGDRAYFAIPDTFIPRHTLFPSCLNKELQQKILTMDALLIRHFGPKFGITHDEYLIDEKTGDMRLVETAIRGGGVFISSDLVPLACGIDVNKMLVELASGKEEVKIDDSKRVSRASGYICFYLPEGTICEVRGVNEVQCLPGVHLANLQNLEVGKKTKPMTHKGSRLGPILIYGEDRQALQEVIHQIQETLVIKVETVNGIKGIVW
jgi:biotin carboxylase